MRAFRARFSMGQPASVGVFEFVVVLVEAASNFRRAAFAFEFAGAFGFVSVFFCNALRYIFGGFADTAISNAFATAS